MRTATSLARIYADEHGLKHRDLTEKLIGLFFSIYNELGHGFLESVYEQAFSVALAENRMFFQRQVALPVYFHGHQVGDLRATDVEIGMLFNFGAKAEFKRYVFDNLNKNPRVSASIRGEEVPET